MLFIFVMKYTSNQRMYVLGGLPIGKIRHLSMQPENLVGIRGPPYEYFSILKIMFSNELILHEAVTFFLIKKIRIKPRVNGSIHTFISFYKPNWHLCQVTPYLYGCILGYPRDKSSWIISTWVRTERKVESLALVLFLSLILLWFVSWTWLRAARIGCADLYC